MQKDDPLNQMNIGATGLFELYRELGSHGS